MGCREALFCLLTMLPRYFSYMKIVNIRDQTGCVRLCFDFIASMYKLCNNV